MIDIATYLNRITSEHKVQPNFMGLVAARLQPFIDLFECFEKIDEAFDIDTAAGKQLDIIGEYIGVKRLLDFQPVNGEAVLDDYYYRMLLKARISLNRWDGSIAGIYKIWGDVFPDYEIQIVDNQNMTMEARIIGLNSPFEGELIHHKYITPKPFGVGVEYSIIFAILISTEISIGGLAAIRELVRSLPKRVLPESETLCGNAFAGEYKVNSKLDKDLPTAELIAEEQITGGVSAGGVFCSSVKNSSIEEKSPPEKFEIECGNLYHIGIKSSTSVVTEIHCKSPPEFISLSAAELNIGTVSTVQRHSELITKEM